MNAISFSLWGDNPRYTEGAFQNIALAREFYPDDWVCVFYVPYNYPLASALNQAGGIVVERFSGAGGWAAVFWRMFPATFPAEIIYQNWVIRDCDSRIGVREWAAVKAWLDSDKTYHVMHDHPNHTPAIMGGMWGGKKPVLNMESMMVAWEKKDHYFDDQNFLEQCVWPVIKDDCLSHTRANWPEHAWQKDGEFVGARHDERGELSGN